LLRVIARAVAAVQRFVHASGDAATPPEEAVAHMHREPLEGGCFFEWGAVCGHAVSANPAGALNPGEPMLISLKRSPISAGETSLSIIWAISAARAGLAAASACSRSRAPNAVRKLPCEMGPWTERPAASASWRSRPKSTSAVRSDAP